MIIKQESDVVVRKAQIDDIDGVIKCAMLFHQNSPIKDTVDFDAEKMKDFVIANIENKDIIFLVATVNNEIVGITGAVSYWYYFSSTAKTTQELFWWVNPEKRGKVGKLMRTMLESLARENESTHIMMIALVDDRLDRMSKLYGRAGYMPVEQSFIKEL